MFFAKDSHAGNFDLDDLDLLGQTNLKDLVEFSIDLNNSKIGIHLSRPVLDYLFSLKYGPSWTLYEEETLLNLNSTLQTVLTMLTLSKIDKVWQETYLKDLSTNGAIDVANQRLPIKMDMKTEVFTNLTHIVLVPNPLLIPPLIPIPVDINDMELLQITSDVTGAIIPKLDSNGDLIFELYNMQANNTRVSGIAPALASSIAPPLIGTPGLQIATLYGILNWTDLMDGAVSNVLQKKSSDPMPVNELARAKQLVNDYFNKIFNTEGTLLNLADPVLDAEGLWIYFTFDPSNLKTIVDDILEDARNNDLIKDIDNYLKVVNRVNMEGFDLSKIDQTKKNLIISLSGAGVYPQVIADGKQPLQTHVIAPIPPLPTYGDGIYPLPSNYINESTVAVVGTPWLSSLLSGSLDDPDNFWGPDPEEFADKVKRALSQMAPESRLILIGKSMGGCKMQKIAEALNDISVDVDLFILVDGSCTPMDQSAIFKDVHSNVKRVYNFRQTMDPPENDNQNGFQLLWSKPTIGQDIVVSDEESNIAMCPGVGHDDIDECVALLSEIDRIIRGVLDNPGTTALPKLSLWTWNEAQYEQNIIKPRFYIQNTGSVPVNNPVVYSYFSVEDGKIPVLEDWYSPNCVPSLEKIGPTNYRIVYDFTGTTLSPGEIYPNSQGNVIGIHYQDWDVMDKNLNYNYTENSSFYNPEYMDIRLEDGTYIFSNIKKDPDPIPTEETITINGNTVILVTPGGVNVRVERPDYHHGLMFTVRNTGTNDYTIVQWHGVLNQNNSNCTDREAMLSGNGAQINNICLPKDDNGEMLFKLKSQDNNSYSVSVEIFDWINGPGCIY